MHATAATVKVVVVGTAVVAVVGTVAVADRPAQPHGPHTHTHNATATRGGTHSLNPTRLSIMNTRTPITLAAMALCVALLSACGGGDEATSDGGGPTPLVDTSGTSSFDSSAMAASLAALPAESLSTAETDSLAFMREEEKLAGDVYARLHTLWGTQAKVFGNIAVSEDNHTEMVRQLLLRYNLGDPASGLAEGQFINTDLQALYSQLTSSGTTSLDAALMVGMTIEELDIRDIQVALQSVDNADIRLVYNELLKGSRNHLRSFYKNLQQRGGSYTPQFITPAEFDAIVQSAPERG